MYKQLLIGLVLLLTPAVLAQDPGDLNGDGQVDPSDVTVLQDYLQGKGLFSDAQTVAADLNTDGRVDKRDLKALQVRLGLIAPPVDSSFNANARDQIQKVPSFELGIAGVVPEWVRGNWRFRSRVMDGQGYGAGGIGSTQNEAITLPGDLSGNYAVYKVVNGVPVEKYDRVCWQVLESSASYFKFVEQSRDRNATVIATTSEITNLGPGRARISLRSEVINPGNSSFSSRNPGYGRNQGFGGGDLLSLLFGGGGNRNNFGGYEERPRMGDFSVRGGNMNREPGSERQRLPNVNLESLRCR